MLTRLLKILFEVNRDRVSVSPEYNYSGFTYIYGTSKNIIEFLTELDEKVHVLQGE